MSYTNVFGGQTVQPSQLSYQAIALTDDIEITWPLNAPPGSTYLADIIDVTPDAAGRVITLPDARNGSNGYNVIFNNFGADAFEVRTNTGVLVVTVASGASNFVYLRDNTTQSGTWRYVNFGSATSSSSAASLAGLGIKAINTTLNQSHPVSSKNATYTADLNDRASLLVNLAGAIAINLPPVGTAGNDWFVLVRNEGSGAMTLTPDGSETIDGGSTKTINPGESCFVICDGTQYYTVGYGRSITQTVTALSKSIAGSGTTTLSATEAAAQVQNFTGTLTGNSEVEYGTAPGYWFVRNNTSGVFTVTFKTDNIDPGVVVAQGTFSIIRSDGTTMSIAFTSASGTVTQINTGTGLTGGPITSTGTISIANTAITPGSYGDASHVATFTVNAQGQLTAAANVSITPAAIGGVPDTRLVSAGSGLTGGGNLSADRTFSIDFTGNYTWTGTNSFAGLTSTGNVAINKASPSFIINSTTATDGTILWEQSTAIKAALGWSVALGSLYVGRYAAGVFVDVPFLIDGTSGDTTVSKKLLPNGGIEGIGGATNFNLNLETGAPVLRTSATARIAYSSNRWSFAANSGTVSAYIDDSGVRSPTNAKAFVYASTAAIVQAFNVSSITNNGTGTFVVNFASALPSNDYSYAAGSFQSGSSNPWIASADATAGVKTSTQFSVAVAFANGTRQNVGWSMLFFDTGVI